MRHEDKALILQQLREIYDGEYKKEYGNSKVVHWKGRMGFLGAGTNAISPLRTIIRSTAIDSAAIDDKSPPPLALETIASPRATPGGAGGVGAGTTDAREQATNSHGTTNGNSPIIPINFRISSLLFLSQLTIYYFVTGPLFVSAHLALGNIQPLNLKGYPLVPERA